MALVGPSGSGKSTLLHLIGLIDESDAGQIRVGDVDLGSLRGNAVADYRASIGIVFQKFYLIGTLTLLENVAAPLVGRRPHAAHGADIGRPPTRGSHAQYPYSSVKAATPLRRRLTASAATRLAARTTPTDKAVNVHTGAVTWPNSR